MIRSISLPVLLILTGSMFLVDYGGGYRVGQTWPILLIWLGISKVLSHLAFPAGQGRSG